MIEAFNYLLVFLMALSGYLLGIGLAYIAPEELKPGRKYLKWLEKGMFVLSFLPVVYFFGLSWWVFLPIVLALVLVMIDFKYRIYLSMIAFLIWFFLIRSSDLIVVLEASAIFLYGLPAGSLLIASSPAAMSKLKKEVEAAR